MDRSSHLRIGADTGGTFTDAVVADSSGRFTGRRSRSEEGEPAIVR
jgi:N-methylhydantoinase A/oxoprolinase/acetone carboxylase beta subunit